MWLRSLVATIGGLATSLLTFAAVYVRGDMAGVIAFLKQRSAWRQLPPEQQQQASAELQASALALADPQAALSYWPLELLAGLLAAWAILALFGRPLLHGSQERFVLRQIYRLGKPVSLSELQQISSLSNQQLLESLNKLVATGTLTKTEQHYQLK